jgi:2-dehydro-3-deoxygluconokinase
MTESLPAAIVAIGEPMVEFNQSDAADPTRWLQGFGGDSSNMVIAAARLGRTSGISAGYVTRIGNDGFGRMLKRLWEREGVSLAGVTTDTEAPTGVYFVSHGPNGHEFSYLRSGSAASRMTPESLPLEVLRVARVLHVSGISQAISASACDACFAAIEAARSAGARISYDPNFRPKLWPLARARDVVRATIALADWVLPSYDDARLMFQLESPDAIADALHAMGASLVVLKLGADGCLVSEGVRRERIEGHRVASIDATGAGDCFDGAFAVRILCGDDPIQAARYANVAAALATTGFGAVAPLPVDAAVRAFAFREGVLA